MMKASSTTLDSSQIRATNKDGGEGEEALMVQLRNLPILCLSVSFQSQLQCAENSSAMFLTASVQNLPCLKLAEELGVAIANPWVSWFKSASLPAIISLLCTPLILYKLYPPETKDTPEAPSIYASKLKQMVPVTKNEWNMVGTMLLAVTLWILG